jgi:hypothetical protein
VRIVCSWYAHCLLLVAAAARRHVRTVLLLLLPHALPAATGD